jgi:signal transduction histidine kinase
MKLNFVLILILINLQAVSNDKKLEETRSQVNLLIEKGEQLIDSSPDSALVVAEQAQLIARSISFTDGIALSLLLKGKTLNAKQEYASALTVLKSAIPYTSTENTRTLGQNYYETGVAFYRLGKADSSIIYTTKALEILDPRLHQTAIAHTERILALAYWSRGMYAEGLLHVQNAIDLYKETNDFRYLSTVYNTKGAILWGLASYEKALEFFFEALYLNERTGLNTAQNILLLNNIGLVYHDWDDDVNALKYFKRAEELIPESENQTGIAYTYLNLGTLYLRNGEISTALELLNKSMNGYASINDINGVCLSKIRIGQCYTEKGEYQKAEESFHNAIDDSRISGNKHRESTAYFQLSKNDIARNDLAAALENSLICLDLAERGQYKDITHALYEQLSEIYERQGEISNAYQMLRKAMTVKEDIYREKIAVQYNIMDLSYENELKEHENSRLKSENLLKQRSLYFMYGAVLLILAALISVSFLYFKLKKKKKELQEANQAKDKIFSIVAHDLRSPVGTLNSMIDILTEEDHGFNYRQMLNKFKPIIAGSFDMLENLLVWAKSNLGKLETNRVPLSLNKEIEETISLFSHFSQEKSIEIKYDAEQEIEVMADKILLETVIRNLLKNAIKFTAERGEIRIKSSIENAFAIISVTDNGIGIPQEVQASVLNGFYHSAGTQNEKGTGLGLMLSKELAEKNGGKLWFKSIEGKGSTFSFSVPLASA